MTRGMTTRQNVIKALYVGIWSALLAASWACFTIRQRPWCSLEQKRKDAHLLVLTAFSTYGHGDYGSVQQLNVNKLIQLRRVRDNGQTGYHYDQALFNFDLKADLSPAFDWNIKQLFVFLVVEYESKKNVLSQVVVWDRIIERKEDAVLNLKAEFLDYPLRDPAVELRNKNITLRLVWDHMPLTGTLFMRSDLVNSTILPDQYT
ncbi:microsomal signal peptidase 23 kd [Nannochloropsis gaditana]|uniref:Signal peptidase complex subunit 3 n=1 Tax=Nannochloropsis gaditana TaxID=72520 RepID=W7TVK2_9STRA|nr:microsomal signal peptidase 23 kd [Nannochloropsis gaditana]